MRGGVVENLPSGYTRLSYIESHGTEYIDTEFIPNQDTRIVAIMMQTASLSIDTHMFGGRKNYMEQSFSILATKDGLVRTDYGNQQTAMSGTRTQDKFTVDKNKNVTNCSNASGATQTVQTAQTFTSPMSLAIFANHSQNAKDGYVTNIGGMRVYSFKIYDNGTLVRNFIPCKNSSGECGLYDLVGDKFYQNVGTGSFTGG